MSIGTIVAVFLPLSMIQLSISHITIEPADDFALNEGESLRLHCIIRNPLYTRIEWFLDKIRLSIGTETQYSDYTVDHSATEDTGLSQYSLSFPSVTKENAGKYKCKAFRDGRPPAKSILQVDVYYTPAPQYPICYYEGNTSSLHCESEKGNPLIELQWNRLSSNDASNVTSTNSDSGGFTHTQIARLEELPKPLFANDLLVCSFQAEPHRNCTLSYIEIFNNIQPPVVKAEESSVLVGGNVSLICDVTNYFTDSMIIFGYETIPTGISLSKEQVNDTLTIIDIPPSVESIAVTCILEWGMLQSVSSTVLNISVIHPSTQPPSSSAFKDHPVPDDINMTPSLSSVGGMITSIPTSNSTSTVTLKTHTQSQVPTTTTSSSSTSFLLFEDPKNDIIETTAPQSTMTDIGNVSSEVVRSTRSTSISPPPQLQSSSLPPPPSPPPSLPPPSITPSLLTKDSQLGTTLGSSTEMETQSLRSTQLSRVMKTVDVVGSTISSSEQQPSTLPPSTLPPSSSPLTPTTPSSSSSSIIRPQLSTTIVSSTAMKTQYLKSTSLSPIMKTSEIVRSTISSRASPQKTPSSSFPPPSSPSYLRTSSSSSSSSTSLSPVMKTSVEASSSSTDKRTKVNRPTFANSNRPSRRSQPNTATTTTGATLSIAPQNHLFQEKYFIPLIVGALLLVAVGTLVALKYAKRRCTEHGQYTVVTKMIWVNNGTSTAVPLKEIHI